MKAIIIKYGIIAGVVVSVLLVTHTWLAASGRIPVQFSEYAGYAGMIISLSAIFAGIKKFRDGHNQGKLTFKEGIKVGLSITLIASIIYTIVWLIYSNTAPAEQMMNEYFDTILQSVESDPELTEDEIQLQKDKMMEMKENYRNPLFKSLITFMEIFPVGVLITLVSSWLLKRSS